MRWLVFALWLVAGTSLAEEHPHGAPRPEKSGDPGYAGFSAAMGAGMDKMMRDMHAGSATGNVDIDFLAMMIPHHEGAVEMARLLLVHGRDPATRRLAAEIISSQMVEIEGMRRRLAELRAGRIDEFPALGGTRGPDK